MEFKKADKVTFVGGNLPVGIKEGTDELVIVNLPKVTTYIWEHIKTNDINLYVIQHNQGTSVEDLLAYSHNYGEIDIRNLNLKRKYALVPEESLVMVEASNYVEPKAKVETDIPSENSTEEAQPTEELVKFEEVEEEEIVVGVDMPHYTPQTCPKDLMMNTVAKSVLIKSMKMTEPFTIDGIKGVEKGRAGDFLMLGDSDFLFIYPKEGFESSYEYTQELIALNVLGKTFNILPELAEYIDQLQVYDAPPLEVSNEEVVENTSTDQAPSLDVRNEEVLENTPTEEAPSKDKVEADMKLADALSETIGTKGTTLRKKAQFIMEKHPEVKEIVFKKVLVDEDGKGIEKFQLDIIVGEGYGVLEITE